MASEYLPDSLVFRHADQLNSPSGWAQDAQAVVISRIVDSGIPVVVSEGNDGGVGMFYASTPATGYSITGTGAVSNIKFPTFLQRGYYTAGSNSTNSSATDNFGFLMGVPEYTVNTTLPLWSAVESNNACEPLPENVDLSDRIVVLEFPDSRATGCYPIDQGDNIVARGGRFMIYYDRDNMYVNFSCYWCNYLTISGLCVMSLTCIQRA